MRKTLHFHLCRKLNVYHVTLNSNRWHPESLRERERFCTRITQITCKLINIKALTETGRQIPIFPGMPWSSPSSLNIGSNLLLRHRHNLHKSSEKINPSIFIYFSSANFITFVTNQLQTRLLLSWYTALFYIHTK